MKLLRTNTEWLRAVSISVVLVCSAAAAAQDNRPSGLLHPSPGLTARPTGLQLDLRANASGKVHLYLDNPSADSPTVNVTVKSGDLLLAAADNVQLAARSFTRVSATVPADAPKPSPDAPGLALPRNAANRVQLTVTVTDVSNRAAQPTVTNQTVVVLDPSQLVTESATFFGTNRRLAVNVQTTLALEPPCDVALVVAPSENPDLLATEPTGVTAGKLSPDVRQLQLFVAGLTPRAGSTGRGLASLTLDKVPRAVVLQGSFAPRPGEQSNPFRRVTEPAVLIDVARFARPGEKREAKVNAVNVPDNASLVFAVAPANDPDNPSYRVPKPGPRDVNVYGRVAPDGKAFDLTTTVGNWTFPLETGTTLAGAFRLTATAFVRNPDGRETLVTTGSALFTVDGTPPQEVTVAAVEPDAIIRGRKFQVRATGADAESGIRGVEFATTAFPPLVDGKPASEVKSIPARPTVTPEGRTVYVAELPPYKEAGQFPVHVRFTNGVGLVTDGVAEIKVAEAPTTGSIRGQATYGGVAQQSEVTVYLMSKDGKSLVDTTTVGGDGYFVFKNVAPGDYWLVGEQKRPSRPYVGKEKVTVKVTPDPTPATVVLSMTR